MNPLFAVRDCLRDRQLASAAEIAACVQVSTPIAEDMLAHWVQRGLIERIDAQGGVCSSGSCGGCGLCGARKTAALYQWRGPQAAAAATSKTPVLMLRTA
ncbi:MAG: FeoC-like transcriptional regulator [Thiomonas sp.]|uniref:FeoC-like transcriptional regulator n=1 Tax=Thiomonas sp. TaxID=2047785 RepID=UPI002A35C036|nr:FeoC-like transcriptional regulator [Thiomonas sp.]MDY0329903.1 FeoC-like transcriptional regulator [Thiomonas sp.]